MAWLIKFTVIYDGTNNRNGSGNIVFIDYAVTQVESNSCFC